VNELRSLLSNCKTLILSNSNYALTYIKRQTNKIAYNLAKTSVLHLHGSLVLSFTFHFVLTLLFCMKRNELSLLKESIFYSIYIKKKKKLGAVEYALYIYN